PGPHRRRHRDGAAARRRRFSSARRDLEAGLSRIRPMKPRIMLAGLYHETHTFLEGVTRWSDFSTAAGAEILKRRGDASRTDGFLEVAERRGWEVVPTFHAQVQPSAIVEDAAFESYWKELAPRATAALASGIDAIYLVLHGAMATETLRDTEGELLARLRAL